MSWEPVIGLEIHLELTTKQKMFCRCSADHFGKQPNSQTCPVCLGLPGALPYPNQKAIERTLLLGLALNCQIPSWAKFDRKNYFYPDLPKGYQISQYDQPFCRNGKLSVVVAGKSSLVRINRVHLEEDTGKLIHASLKREKWSLIDFNRSGVPLVEIVTEPDINSLEVLPQFTQMIRQLVRALGISSANMEKGQMRFELNLSLRPKGNQSLPPYRVEVKNINSFKFLQQAAKYEIIRQTKIFRSGGQPIQETRGFDAKKQITVSQRGKEKAHDYRYFPEPDLPPFFWEPAEIKKLKEKLPELPQERADRFQKMYGLSLNQTQLLVAKEKQALYFEKAARFGQPRGISSTEIANLLINKRIDLEKISPKMLVLRLTKRDREKGMNQKQIEKIINLVLNNNQETVLRYLQGKVGLFEFFVGQVMKDTKGQANPRLIRKILSQKLSRAT